MKWATRAGIQVDCAACAWLRPGTMLGGEDSNHLSLRDRLGFRGRRGVFESGEPHSVVVGHDQGILIDEGLGIRRCSLRFGHRDLDSSEDVPAVGNRDDRVSRGRLVRHESVSPSSDDECLLNPVSEGRRRKFPGGAITVWVPHGAGPAMCSLVYAMRHLPLEWRDAMSVLARLVDVM
jgi:hypothetical protein